MFVYLENFNELEDKYNRVLKDYVNYQEDASYKIEKLEKANDPGAESKKFSKFNIKTKAKDNISSDPRNVNQGNYVESKE